VLGSICIPSSIETICASCFNGCENLVRIVVESESRLSGQCRIDLRSRFFDVQFGSRVPDPQTNFRDQGCSDHGDADTS
jgi:hypothetical protein